MLDPEEGILFLSPLDCGPTEADKNLGSVRFRLSATLIKASISKLRDWAIDRFSLEISTRFGFSDLDSLEGSSSFASFNPT